MLTIEISWEEVKFFIALIVSGSLYGWYCYKKGLKRGWDHAIFALEDYGFLSVDDSGNVIRMTDKEFRDYQESVEYSD